MIQRRLSISIRYALPIFFIVLIIVTAVLVGGLAFNSGTDAVNILIEELSGEIMERNEQHVAEFVETPHLFHEINVAAIENGNIDLNDFSDLERYFGQQVQVDQSVPFISFGTAQGEYLGVELMGDELIVRVRDELTGPKRTYHYLDSSGNRGESLGTDASEYDPCIRNWYESAVAANKSAWSPIYLVASRSTFAISPVVPVYDNNGDVQGVLATLLTLSQLSEFLQDLDIGMTGEAFIIERSGELVASSSEIEPPYITNGDEQLNRLLVTKSNDPLIQATAQELLDVFGDFSSIDRMQSRTFVDANNARQFVQITPLQDEHGLDWLIVVVVPESDFTGPIDDQKRVTIGMAVVGVLLAAILGGVVARWIISPVLIISDAATAVETGTFELDSLDSIVQRGDEIGRLAYVFQRMVHEIYAREQKLKAKVQELRIEIDTIKSGKRVKEIVDSEFFKELEASAKQMRQRRSNRRRRK